jgi:hypothetical protein
MDSNWSNGGKWQGDFPPLMALRCGKILLGILLGLFILLALLDWRQ